MKPELFKYLDYRKYLLDFYNYAKEAYSHFSYQYLAQKVGIDTSNLAKVFQMNRHLPTKAVSPLIEILHLDEREQDYFQTLVAFGKARNATKKQELFLALLSQQESQPRFIAMNEYHFYAHWYHTAIYGLLDCYCFTGDFKELAHRLEPSILVSQAKESIELLLKLGLVKIDESGRYIPVEQILSTGEEWKSYAITSFQEETIDLAKRALKVIPNTKRDINTLTFTASKKELKELQEITKEYRKKVIELISQSDNSTDVYQLNMQLFPLSQRGKQ